MMTASPGEEHEGPRATPAERPSPETPSPAPAPIEPASPASARPEGLIALAASRPVAVTMVVLTVVIFGLISFDRLPRNLMPDIAYPTITVRTEYPGSSPIDVEPRVSRRLEEVLSQVRGLRRISSVSRAEISDVILEFAWGTNMSLATMEVREKVEQAYLPTEASRPTVLRYDPTLDPILQIGLYLSERFADLSSDPERLVELRVLAEDLLERELETVEGVAAVQVRGGLEREIRIELSEELLKAKGVSTTLIAQRLKDENLNQASGQLYEGDQAYVVRTVNEFVDIEEIEDIILKRDGNVPVRLKEVATVSLRWAEPEVLSRVNDRPCIKVEVFKEADANVVDVARRVRSRIFGTPTERERLAAILQKEREAVRLSDAEFEAEVRKSLEEKRAREGKKGKSPRESGRLEPPPASAEPGKPSFIASRMPLWTEMSILSDQSAFIQGSLDDVRSTAISGGILAILVLYLFLRRPWFTFAVGLSIPISVVATFVAMHVFGVSLNMMSLGGLALGVGMLVDSSIVVLESIFRCRQEGDGPYTAAVRGARLVSSAVVASTLTTVAVFFPIVFVEGVAAQIFRDQALTVVISLLASLVVALHFIPACVGRDWSASRRALAVLASGAPPLPEGPRRLAGRLPPGRARWLLAPAALVVFWVGFLCRWILLVVGRALLALASWVVLGVRGLLQLAASLGGGLHATFFKAWDRVFDASIDAYARLLRRALRARFVVLALGAVALAASGLLFQRIGTELVPEVHQGEFTIDVRLPVGVRLERTDEILDPLEAAFLAERATLGIDSITATLGVEKSSIKAGDEGEHTAKILVKLAEGGNFEAREEIVKERFRQILAGRPELSSYKFENPVLFSFKTPIEVELKGYSLSQIKQVALSIEERMRASKTLRDVKSTVGTGFPEIHLELDREILSRYGLTVAGVGQVLRQKLQGEVPTYFSDGDRKVGLRVRLREEDRSSIEGLKHVIINPGAPVELRLLDILPTADLVVSEGPAEIRRINQQRAAVVTANIGGLDLGRATREVQGIMSSTPMPSDFLVGFGGQKDEMDHSLESLANALLLAIFLVYVVMAIQFESLVQPLIILLSVPLAVVGVSPVLWALGIPLSIVVFIGLIVLAGIVVNNAIVLVDYINQLRSGGMERVEAIVRSGCVRMRPILMTTLTTVLGLLPLTGMFGGVPGLSVLLGTGQGAEIRAPMAITVVAGLLASTALTLIFVPVVYDVITSLLERSRDTLPAQAPITPTSDATSDAAAGAEVAP